MYRRSSDIHAYGDVTGHINHTALIVIKPWHQRKLGHSMEFESD
jgi:hypothetical protein